jgi:hypothetical protein
VGLNVGVETQYLGIKSVETIVPYNVLDILTTHVLLPLTLIEANERWWSWISFSLVDECR